MGTLFLDHIKKQASNFLQEKYKTVRLTFTDVTQAELLAEEATNSDPCSPDAKTMTKIAAASFEMDDYWRVVDILHRKFYNIDWKEWRQSYKALVLLEFLLTHGPEEFAEEFRCDIDVIQELGSFKYTDKKGFNWGASMQKKSDQILNLLGGGQTLREARLKALKITNEIQGFGSATASPSSSTPSSSTSEVSRASFGSFSTTSSVWNDINELSKSYQPSPTKSEAMESYSPGGFRDCYDEKTCNFLETNENSEGSHLWDCPAIQERGSLLESEDEDDANHDRDDEEYYEKAPDGNLISGMFSKLVHLSPPRAHGETVSFRSVSDAGRREGKKKFDRQYSLWY